MLQLEAATPETRSTPQNVGIDPLSNAFGLDFRFSGLGAQEDLLLVHLVKFSLEEKERFGSVSGVHTRSTSRPTIL